DANPPRITSTTLPSEGTTISSVYDRFSVGFSEDMAAGTVNDPNNIEIRAAGADGSFDSADDVLYQVASYGYTSGLSVSYRIT
ncbi:Ig-like domain-containing protein, partial [Escherichia coli]|uniref:Ig-like domain-containing protein n=1 Tax=Escherichia coli TaxID=562 RepID=UPI001411DDDF